MWMPETLGDFNNYLKISEITRYTQKLDISNVLQSSVFQQETFQHLKKKQVAISSQFSYLLFQLPGFTSLFQILQIFQILSSTREKLRPTYLCFSDYFLKKTIVGFCNILCNVSASLSCRDSTLPHPALQKGTGQRQLHFSPSPAKYDKIMIRNIKQKRHLLPLISYKSLMRFHHPPGATP